MKNRSEISFHAVSPNESFARIVIAAFVAPLDPTLEELNEIKTVVSEAVTNAILHGYGSYLEGKIHMTMMMDGDIIEVTIEDFGKGIENLEHAREPLFTTKPEWERSGMGFTIMENFSDYFEVHSHIDYGTKVMFRKKIRRANQFCH